MFPFLVVTLNLIFKASLNFLIYLSSVVNKIIRRIAENKFKEALNIRPDYEYGHKTRLRRIV